MLFFIYFIQISSSTWDLYEIGAFLLHEEAVWAKKYTENLSIFRAEKFR